MARVWQKSSLKLVLQTDEQKEDMTYKTKSKTFSNLMENAAFSDLYEVGASLASLQKHTLIEVQEVVTNLIEEEE